MPISFNFMHAGSGDAILITADEFNMLIDGGNNRMKQYRNTVNEIKKIKEKNQLLDWVVLTHIDDDHINGLIKILKDKQLNVLIRTLWFNAFDNYTVDPISTSSEISMGQLITFEQLVDEIKKHNQDIRFSKNISIEKFNTQFIINDNIAIKLLSPTNEALNKLYDKYQKERKDNQISGEKQKPSDYAFSIEELAKKPFYPDQSITNRSSIAFILSYKNQFYFLLLADAHIDIIVEYLKRYGYSKCNKLKVNFVKLSHHGSKKNLNTDFLDLIETDTFIISSNHSGSHKHPDKETLSKIILHYSPRPVKFIFNNPIFDKIFSLNEQKEYGFELELADKEKLTFG